MSNGDSFIFRCPACQAKLTLPMSLAGIIGPCPSCQTRIQAPSLADLSAHAGAPPAATGAAPHSQAPSAPLPTPMPAPVAELPEPPPPQVPAEQESGRTGYKIEPRQLPNREAPAEVISRPLTPSDSRGPTFSQEQERYRQRHRRGRRGVAALTFLLLAITLVGILGSYLADPSWVSQLLQQRAPTSPNPPVSAPPATSPQVVPDSVPTPPTPVVPPAGEDGPGIAPPPHIPAASVPVVTTVDRGRQALEVLGQFLKATNFDERKELIEATTPEDQLRNTCLSAPLPPATVYTQIQQLNAIESLVDCFYTVAFEGEARETSAQYTLLVRIRGDSSPKVMVEPFLDLYGGRLKKFAAGVDNQTSGTFHVVLNTYKYPRTNVPRPESTFTIKLLNDDNDTVGIAEVTGENNSTIGKMLRDPGSGLAWGKPVHCRVLLEWNRKDPQKPYIEALDIPGLDWNP